VHSTKRKGERLGKKEEIKKKVVEVNFSFLIFSIFKKNLSF